MSIYKQAMRSSKTDLIIMHIKCHSVQLVDVVCQV